MHGSELKDGQHSTPDPVERSKLWPRVLGSMALFGLMVGLMIGKITAPSPTELQDVSVEPERVVLWFNHEPQMHAEQVDGTVVMAFAAQGAPRKGQVQVNGKAANWRVEEGDKGLLMNLVAARPLHGEWVGREEGGRWRLEIRLQEQ